MTATATESAIAAAPVPRRGRRWALASQQDTKLAFRIAVFVLAVELLLCLAAPLYARYVAHTGPNQGALSATVTIGGREQPVVSRTQTKVNPDGTVSISAGGQPIGPQWLAAGGRYVLGADEQGRDVAVRLLYGGRLSLLIGVAAALICISISVLLALTAGYLGGWVDAVIGRALDVLWSLPWLLLSISIGAAFASGGFDHLGVHIGAGSIVLIIGMLSYGPIPYYARALRAQVLSLRSREFVRAAEISGAGRLRILLGELLPNVTALLPAMIALDVANVLLAESTLTYLGVGLQPPTASWGSLIAEGQSQLTTAPWLTLLPALAIVITAISLNVIGERLRGGYGARPVTSL